jgi:hypothetical protein
MYKIVKGNSEDCIRLEKENGVVLLIPMSEDNTDYQEYLAWVAEGNEAEEWNPEGIIE